VTKVVFHYIRETILAQNLKDKLKNTKARRLNHQFTSKI